MARYAGDIGWLTQRPIAHRGYHDMNRDVWENTLTAFERAVAQDFAIECDLQFACDGVPVVFHDEDLERLCGLRGDVRLQTSAELGMRRIGGGRDSIPSLKTALERVAGRVPMILELKGRGARGEEISDDDGFAEAVLEVLEGYAGKVAVMSFNANILRDFIAADCPHPVGLTAEGTTPEQFYEHEDAMDMGLDFLAYRVEHLPNPFVEGVQRLGLPVLSWTVRTEEMRACSDAYAHQMTFEGFDPDQDPAE
ncbi:glycerophosphodiester phosphodiesterase family protein [Pseudohoeflea coraliihabitans]|uniref:Glycerophosphodiester phosphodiesterase n=1 Tax=Pseudohoeflea coraliihabitans TaxID=2860393 RepID=A0ABS6WTW4_9HYPH|nr:glycerophosphodiester phosphodiesterase family protein [Pseudohoeflea sp. DP4N28-3]MBW3098505.1 glycerophosphodiester phosphodiesterase [Pseudohoeflea sp. DP4N28-3]